MTSVIHISEVLRLFQIVVHTVFKKTSVTLYYSLVLFLGGAGLTKLVACSTVSRSVVGFSPTR